MIDEFFDKSAYEAFKEIDNKYLLLPDIQRSFCWEREDIENLFDSIARGYPIGTFIFWKATKEQLINSNQSFYEFIKNYSQNPKNSNSNLDNIPLSELSKDKEDYYIVLDGQQRITALNIGLRGYYEYRVKYKILDENKYAKSVLCFNLNYDDSSKEADNKLFFFEKLPKGKDYFTDEELREKKILPLYYIRDKIFNNEQQLKTINGSSSWKINQIIKELLGEIGIKKISNVDLLSMLIFRLVNNKHTKNDALIHFYKITKDKYDEALDVFVKVNSTGKKLNKNDLLFSRLINNWENPPFGSNPKKYFSGKLNSINFLDGDERFNIHLDFLIRAFIYVLGENTAYNISSLSDEVVKRIRDRNNWDKLINSTEKVFDLVKRIGYSYASLTTYNALLPIIYFSFYDGKLEESSSETKKEIKKYLTACMTTSFFGGSSDYVLSVCRTELNKVKKNNKDSFKKVLFSFNIFKDIKINERKSLNIQLSTINFWLDEFKKDKNKRLVYAILLLLYDDKKLNKINNSRIFDLDHVHPAYCFEAKYCKKNNINIPESTLEEWKNYRDNIANLQLLDYSTNRSDKNKKTFNEWYQSGDIYSTIIPCIPPDEGKEFTNFKNFYDERKRLIKERLMDLYELNNDNKRENN